MSNLLPMNNFLLTFKKRMRVLQFLFFNRSYNLLQYYLTLTFENDGFNVND